MHAGGSFTLWFTNYIAILVKLLWWSPRVQRNGKMPGKNDVFLGIFGKKLYIMDHPIVRYIKVFTKSSFTFGDDAALCYCLFDIGSVFFDRAKKIWWTCSPYLNLNVLKNVNALITTNSFSLVRHSFIWGCCTINWFGW